MLLIPRTRKFITRFNYNPRYSIGYRYKGE